MITSELDIWNKALRHVAIGVEVKSLTENSTAAAACRAFYDDAVDAVESDFPWPFTIVQGALTLLVDNTATAGAEWQYTYQKPIDCLRLWRIRSGQRRDTLATRIPYRETAGGQLQCDLQAATAEWTQRVTDVTQFPTTFVTALAYRLASEIAIVITGGDTFKLADRAAQLYQLALLQAKALAAQSEVPDAPVDATWISDRA